jgi:aminoglycoside 2'-N-acetyltransferase I
MIIRAARTEELDTDTRAAIVHVCRTAHQEDDFLHLFSYIPSGGIHVLAYREQELVSHAVVTTRWLQPEGLPVLRTAYVDAVATLPAYQGQGIGSRVMRHLASVIPDFEIACLETQRVSFYAQLGWELWRGPLAGRRDSGKRKEILIPSVPLRSGVALPDAECRRKWDGLNFPLPSELLPTPEQQGIMILRLPRTPPLDLDCLLVIEYDGRIW